MDSRHGDKKAETARETQQSGRAIGGGPSDVGLRDKNAREKQDFLISGSSESPKNTGECRFEDKDKGKNHKEVKPDSLNPGGRERRDFLVSGLALVGACGAAALGTAFIGQLRPDSSQTGAATMDIDISGIKAGEQIIVDWRGQPVIIRNRLPAEVAAAQKTAAGSLEDKWARNANLPANALADDVARSGGRMRENWLVFINICTHLGCPTQKVEGGWFCPCHGSRYDMAARVIKGPANRNMAIPPYRFLSETQIQIG